MTIKVCVYVWERERKGEKGKLVGRYTGIRFEEGWDEFFLSESFTSLQLLITITFMRLLSTVLSKPSPSLQCPINKIVLSATPLLVSAFTVRSVVKPTWQLFHTYLVCELPFQIMCVYGFPWKKRNFAYYPNRGLSGSSFRRDSGLGLIIVSVDCGSCFWSSNGSLKSH